MFQIYLMSAGGTQALVVVDVAAMLAGLSVAMAAHFLVLLVAHCAETQDFGLQVCLRKSMGSVWLRHLMEFLLQ